MFFTQKTQLIVLPKQQELVRLISTTSRMLLIATRESLFLYDSFLEVVKSSLDVGVPGQDQSSSLQSQRVIHNVEYHPYSQNVYMIIECLEPGEIKYLLVSTHIQDIELSVLKTHWDSSKNPTKYGTKEFKPKVITVPKSEYVALIRDFHIDSELVIFKGDAQTSSFFINQQCMRSYDDSETLVSFRNYFKQTITIELVNIVSAKQSMHKLPAATSGTLLTVKKLPCSNSMLLVINWADNRTEYVIIDEDTMDYVHTLTLHNQRVINFFWFSSPYAVSLSFVGNSPQLTLNQIVSGKVLMKDQIDESLEFEEWDSFATEQDSSVVLSYSQDIRTFEVSLKTTMIVQRKEGYALMFNQLLGNESDTLIQHIWNMLN